MPYSQMPFLMLTHGDGEQYFIETPYLGDCQPKLKSALPTHDMQTVPHQVSNWNCESK